MVVLVRKSNGAKLGKRKSLKQIRQDGIQKNDTEENRIIVQKPKENQYYRQILKLKATIPSWDNLFDRQLNHEDRMNDWVRIEVLGEPLLKKYAWAIPDNQSLNILKNFSSIIEIGAGKGYWASLMQKEGINITPYDITIQEDSWTTVIKGDPSILLTKRKKFPRNTALFLCYPDEGSSVGIECLTNILQSTQSTDSFCQYLIHVGELIHTGCASGSPQAPWGRSSSPDFQVKLSECYHCILVHPLLSFPYSRDFLTVWKRTITLNMKEREMEGSRGNEEEEEDEEEDDEDEWADIPNSERLFNNQTTIVSPAYRHLLSSSSSPSPLHRESDKNC